MVLLSGWLGHREECAEAKSSNPCLLHISPVLSLRQQTAFLCFLHKHGWNYALCALCPPCSCFDMNSTQVVLETPYYILPMYRLNLCTSSMQYVTIMAFQHSKRNLDDAVHIYCIPKMQYGGMITDRTTRFAPAL